MEKREVDRVIRLLRTLLRMLGFTNREIERRLGYTPSYLTRLFGGQIELKFEHILQIERAMGLKPGEIFDFAYPRRGQDPSPAAVKLRDMLEEMHPSREADGAQPGPILLSPEQVDARIKEALQDFFVDLGKKARG